MLEVTIDNYKITGIIGRGGMGDIYYGEDQTLKRPVAIKMVRTELLGRAHVVDRFRSEAITTAKLNHPNIATVYELIQQNNSLFLIMEFVRGWTLSQTLRICETMMPQVAIAVVNSALSAIGYAHKEEVIHRDLKPTNLMLNENGLIKVMDFGIARVLSGPKHTSTGQMVGTLKYMPPEQIRGDDPDARTDIYALGIVMYKLLTGRVPFSSDSDYQLMRAQVEKPPPPPKQFADRISDQLQAVILKALSKSAEDRYADTEQFAQALSQCPESRGADQGKLDDLARYMQQKHPIATTPLNQQALETLKSATVPAVQTPKNGWQRFRSAATNIRHTISGSKPTGNGPGRLNWRRYAVISLCTLTIGTLAFWFLQRDQPKMDPNFPYGSNGGYEDRPVVDISEPDQDSLERQLNPEQGNTDPWKNTTIKR